MTHRFLLNKKVLLMEISVLLLCIRNDYEISFC